MTRDRNGNDNPGRDHNNEAFSVWLAGGGVKGGTVYGATDEFGAKAVENKVHIHDLHATILHLLGFDHTRLTYRYNGRDFRLTDNFGNGREGGPRVRPRRVRRPFLLLLTAPSASSPTALGPRRVGAASGHRAPRRRRRRRTSSISSRARSGRSSPTTATSATARPAGSPRSSLALDWRGGWEEGGVRGPAIVAGDPENSLLIEAVRYRGRLQMPPDGKLSAEQVERSRRVGAHGRARSAHGAAGRHAPPSTAAAARTTGRSSRSRSPRRRR